MIGEAGLHGNPSLSSARILVREVRLVPETLD